MRDVARILPLCVRLAHAWMRSPDERLGQIITNAFGAEPPPGMFYIEDEELVAKIEKYLAR